MEFRRKALLLVFLVITIFPPGYSTFSEYENPWQASTTNQGDVFNKVYNPIFQAITILAGGSFVAILFTCYHYKKCPLARVSRNQGITIRRSPQHGSLLVTTSLSTGEPTAVMRNENVSE